MITVMMTMLAIDQIYYSFSSQRLKGIDKTVYLLGSVAILAILLLIAIVFVQSASDGVNPLQKLLDDLVGGIST